MRAASDARRLSWQVLEVETSSAGDPSGRQEVGESRMQPGPTHLGKIGRGQLLGGSVRRQILEERIHRRQFDQVLLGRRILPSGLGPLQFDISVIALELLQDRLQRLLVAPLPGEIASPTQPLLRNRLDRLDQFDLLGTTPVIDRDSVHLKDVDQDGGSELDMVSQRAETCDGRPEPSIADVAPDSRRTPQDIPDPAVELPEQ